MASKLFTNVSIVSLNLEEIRRAIMAVADRLNRTRNSNKSPDTEWFGFATVYVGPVLKTPATGSTSFLVSYSDKDLEAPRLIEAALRQAIQDAQERCFCKERDPYCA